MLDFTHIPSNVKADIQVFSNGSTSDWKIWNKPRGVSMVYMLCIGGGGGGGAGASSAAGSGGTGGSSSSQSSLILPSFMIPDNLNIRVGIGGAGGTGVLNAVGGRGQCGSNSVIAIDSASTDKSTILEYFGTGITLAAASPHITMASTAGIEAGMHVTYLAANGTGSVPADATVLSVLSGTTIQLSANSTAGTSGNASVLRFIRKNGVLLTATGGIGGPGGTTAVGTAGTATPINTVAQCPLAGLGRYNFIAGQAGTAGSDVGNNGTAITYATTGLLVMGGSGGGAPTGGTATGMALTAAGVFPGVAGATGAGSNGFSLNPPTFALRFTGGLGGAGGATSSLGGNGAYGCGGGGSGGCPAAATSVSGGNGGDGQVVIISW